MGGNNTPKKCRWYHNLADTHHITKRAYPWVAWPPVDSAILTLCLALVIAALTDGNWILWTILGVALGATVAITILSLLVHRAMYTQIDGTVGPVYAVLSQIKSGWIVSKEPVDVTHERDVIWHLIGRPGVVFISEGPSNRVQPFLSTEHKKISRVTKSVPVHVIRVGHDEGQIELAKLERRLRKLGKVLTKEKVPAVSTRLKALGSRGLPIPKGMDPTKVHPNHRAMRGR